MFGVPSIVGPYYENTKRVATELAAASGAMLVNDSDELLATTKDLLNNAMQRTVHGLSAQKWVNDEASRVARIIHTLATGITN